MLDVRNRTSAAVLFAVGSAAFRTASTAPKTWPDASHSTVAWLPSSSCNVHSIHEYSQGLSLYSYPAGHEAQAVWYLRWAWKSVSSPVVRHPATSCLSGREQGGLVCICQAHSVAAAHGLELYPCTEPGSVQAGSATPGPARWEPPRQRRSAARRAAPASGASAPRPGAGHR